jgi:hypothetical protein
MWWKQPNPPLEVGDGGEDALAAPCSPPAAGKPSEGRLVKVRIISMPVLGAATMEFSGRKGLAATRSRQLELPPVGGVGDSH